MRELAGPDHDRLQPEPHDHKSNNGFAYDAGLLCPPAPAGKILFTPFILVQKVLSFSSVSAHQPDPLRSSFP
jgi:hypothetical protein